MVHRLEAYSNGKTDGQKLTIFTAHRFLRLIRTALVHAKVVRGDETTPKMFRATMVAEGESLGAILLAGDWGSAAFLRYCQENEIDYCRFMEASTDGSGDEYDVRVPEIDPVRYLENLDFQHI